MTSGVLVVNFSREIKKGRLCNSLAGVEIARVFYLFGTHIQNIPKMDYERIQLRATTS